MMNISPNYSIYHFLSPRNGDSFAPQVKLIESEEGISEKILNMTDEFNADSKEDNLYSSADSLSVFNQKKYTCSLITLAVIGVLMVLSFLLYDEVDFVVCLPLYAVFLIGGSIFLRHARNKKYHEKYYQYRMLAESLRVQGVLNGLGIKQNAAESYTWTQQEDTAWIKKAIDAVDAVFEQEVSRQKALWIDEQLGYHKDAMLRTAKKKKANDCISKLLLIITIFFIFVGIAIEALKPEIMRIISFGVEIKTVYLVLIGTLSAISLFLSSYYGKLALGRKISDHANMIKLYSRANKLIAEDGFSDSVALIVAREEIVENGNWYSYVKENELDINV